MKTQTKELADRYSVHGILFFIWCRDNLFKDLSVEELSKKVMEYRQAVK